MPNDSLKCFQAVRHVPESAYARPTDGRKAGAVRAKRRTLVIQLAGYANPDGSSIKPSVDTIATDLGWARRTVLYLLDDLEEMGLISNEKLTGWNGTRIRRLHIEKVLALQNSPSSSAPLDSVGVQDSGVGVQDSSAVGVQNGVSSSAKQPLEECKMAGQGPGNPAILHTTVPTEPLPPANRKHSAPQIGADGWKEFLENLRPCPEMEKAPMNKTEEAALRKGVAKHGGTIGAKAALCWYAERNTKGIDRLWHFFLKEHRPFLREAIENTPGADGLTPAQRKEDEMVASAAALDRKLALERFSKCEPEESPEETMWKLLEAK